MKKIQHNWKKRILSLGVIGCLSFQLFGLAPVSAQDLHLGEPGSSSWQPEAAETYNSTAGDLTLEELSRASLALADVPEMVDLKAVTENGHVNRLYQQEEDLNTVIFQNRDGTKTMYYFASPVKYVDESGEVRDKKNVLHGVADPAFTEDYQYVNSENDVTTYFPKRLDGDSGIVMTDGSLRIDVSPVHKTLQWNGLLSSLTQAQRAEVLAQPGADKIRALDAKLQTKNGLAAQNLSKQDMVTTEIAALPADAEKKTIVRQDAAHDDESVEYADAFGEGTSLRYNPELDGFGSCLVLERNVGVNSFTYRIKTNGLTLLEQDGKYVLMDALTGEVKGTLGDIVVQDSSTSGVDTAAYNHTYQVETVEEDDEYLVTMVLDEAYLNSADTVYPLAATISLTVSYAGVDDATIYTNNKNPAGSSGSLFVGQNGSNGVGRVLIKFPNLFANNSVLKTQNILSATLRVRDLLCEPAQSAITVNMMKVGWTESTVKCTPTLWNGYDTTFLDQRTVGLNKGTGRNGTGTGNWYNFNITKAVQAWKGGSYGGQNGNYGVMLRATNEALPCRTFSSSNRSITTGEDTRPFLVVNYDGQVDATSIVLSTHSLKMNIGAVSYLSAVVCPTNATNKNVTWSVADSTIVSVQLGRVEALKAGTTTITVTSHNGKKDTCQVTVIFPTNGSEIAYQPSLWNGTLKSQTNCYSYALNNQDNRALTGGLQPGMLYDGKIHTDCKTSSAKLVEWIEKDAEKAGFTFEKIKLADYNKACSNGHYRVALVLDVGVDYHWYRQNPDGTWSHKRGTTEVTNVDASGKIIYNPETANRSYSNANYDVFVGFFEISPLVHSSGYSATAAQIDNELTASLPQSQRNIEQVQEGMTYNQVMECMGKADLTGQWGSFIEEYELSQNEIAHIYYGTGANGDVVVDSVQILQR